MVSYADGCAFIFVSNDVELSVSVRGGTIVICSKTNHILFPSKFFSSSRFIIGHRRILLFDNPTHLVVVKQMEFCGQQGFSSYDVFRRALNCLDSFDYIISKMIVVNLNCWS